MFAVIFNAQINELDAEYAATAERMRKLATSRYGCVEFIACTEGSREIAISYWNSLEQIRAWKTNPEHLRAQALGKSKWYKSYQVRIVEVVRQYDAK
ncbi:MAG: antibiotic biosynthesis monooxygenase [Desulfobacteraceae bacterium]